MAEIIKKYRYTNIDFEDYFTGTNKLHDVRTELLSTIDALTALPENQRYGGESLGVVIFGNRYIDQPAYDEKKAILDTFEATNLSTIMSSEGWIKNLLADKNNRPELTEELWCYSQFELLRAAFFESPDMEFTEYFQTPLSDEEITELKLKLSDYNRLEPLHQAAIYDVNMTTGYIAGIYKANGETEVRSGTQAVMNVDGTWGTGELPPTEMNKNLIGLAYISDAQFNQDRSYSTSAMSAVLAGELSGVLGTMLPTRLKLNLDEIVTKLNMFDAESIELGRECWLANIKNNSINLQTTTAAAKLSMDLTSVSEDILKLCKNINTTGLTGEAKAQLDSLYTFACYMSVLLPLGPLATFGVAGVIEAVDKFLRVEKSVALGGIEVNAYFNGIFSDGMREPHELALVQPPHIDTTLNFGLNGIVADGKKFNHVVGNSENNVIWARDGSGNILKGMDGNDILSGYKYTDTLDGGIGNDTYIYVADSGNDTIIDEIDMSGNLMGNPHANAGSDTLVMVGIRSEDVRIMKDGNDLILSFINKEGAVRIKNHYYSNSGEKLSPIEYIQFDGEIAPIGFDQWLIEGTEGCDTGFTGNNYGNLIYGYGGDDEIHAHLGNDTIYGGSGMDTIYAGEGKNVIEGGRDNDTIDAGRQRDIFVFNVGDGQDTITDWGGNDNLILNGINPASVAITANSSGDMILSFGSDQITLKDYYKITANGSFVQFDNGTGKIENVYTCVDGKATQINYNPYTQKITLVPINNPEFVLQEILKTLNTDYTQAQTIQPPRWDPLVLDMDGDGVEVGSRAAGVHFDLDGNGFKEKTAWVKADDALLVRDLNGDGLISSGGELFGDRTLLANGQLAANGFAALAELDANNDGRIDGLDAAFSQLRVWKDANQDGISQEEELQDLTAAGVKSIATGSGATNTTDANGNTLVRSGSFTKVDDTTGTVAEYLLNRDAFDTVDGAVLPETAELAALPDVAGRGTVRNLRNAMALDTTGTLKTLVSNFANAQQINTCMAMVETILFQWTGSSAIAAGSRGFNIDARVLNVLEQFNGISYAGTDGANPIALAADRLKLSYDQLKGAIYTELMVQTHLKPYWDAMELETVAGVPVGNLEAAIPLLDAQISANSDKGDVLLYEFTKALTAMGVDKYTDYEGFKTHFNSDGRYNWIFDNVTSYMVYGTDLCETLTGTTRNDVIFGYNGNDLLYGQGGNDTLYGGTMADQLFGGVGNDVLDGGSGDDVLTGGGGSDTYIFTKNSNTDRVIGEQWDFSVDTIWFKELSASEVTFKVDQTNPDNLIIAALDGSTQMVVEKYFSSFLDKLQFRFGSETVLSLDATKAMTLKFTIEGSTTDDVLKGAAPAVNTLIGYSGNDTLDGGFRGDTLDGGSGDDILNGGAGGDTYIVRRGDGRDRITETYYAAGASETLWFKDIAPEELQFTAKSGSSDLLIRTADGSYQVTLANYFGGYHNRLRFQFGDGDPWSLEATQALSLRPVVTGTTQDDSLNVPWSSNASIFGGSGNDTIEASGSGETYGGSGNDELRGSGEGSILDGGAGTDKLISFSGQDTVVFARGGGRDLVQLSLSGEESGDVIWFKDYLPGDIEFTVDKFISNSLLIRAADGSCEMVITNYFSAENPQVLLKFGNGEVLSPEDSAALLGNLTLTGTAGEDWIDGADSVAMPLIGGGGNDMLRGGALGETLIGGAGNDRLDGGNGNDILNGGAGDDVLIGGLGSDVFEFDGLNGFDTLSFESSRYGSDVETIWLKNMTPSDVVFSYDSENPANLVLMSLDGTNRLTVENYFGGVNSFTQFRFDSSPTLTVAESMTLTAQAVMTGGAGAEVLAANPNAATVLNGGAGDDKLTGASFNDVLDGGAGDDTLTGGGGSDTYIFEKNNGRDRIKAETGRNPGDVETIWFKGLTSSNVVFTKEVGATNNLLIASTDGLTRMVIENYFTGENDYYQFKFGDAVPLTVAQSKAMAPGTLGTGITGDDIKTAPTNTATTLTGGAGDDTLTGGNMNDTLDGGTGNDILKGGLGSDVFIFAKNGGKDRLLFESSYYTTDMDTIKFTDVSLAELSFRTEQSTEGLPHLLIETADGTQLIVENYFNSAIRDRIRFQFGAAAALTAAQTQVLTMSPVNTGGAGDDTLQITYYTGGTVNGGAGNDNILGGNGGDVLNGDAGNDEIIGYDGNDTIDGGAGNDVLMGAYGNDTYVFTRNGGMDTIKDDSPNQATSVETIWFKDVTRAEIVFKPDQYFLNTLHIETLDGSARMTIENYYNNSLNRYRFQFGTEAPLTVTESRNIALGAIVTGSEKDDHLQGVLSTGNTLYGNGGNDWMFGSETTDVLHGGAGNDNIQGFAGNDRLIGGAGDDTLDGGAGADTYVFSKGDGQDTVILTGTEDVLELGSGIGAGDLIVSWVGGNLHIQIADSDDRLTLTGWESGNKLSAIRLASGEVLSAAQLEAMQYVKVVGTDGDDTLMGQASVNDYLIGKDGNDVIEGMSGNDRIVGGSGADTYRFSLGDGQDTYTLAGIEDALELGDGIALGDMTGTLNTNGDYVLTIGAGTDTLTFKNWYGGNKLASLKLADGTVLTTAQLEELAGILNGTSGDDILTAAKVMDYTINGGAGADTITGNSGKDTITGGTGNDSITGGAGVDTYLFSLGDGQDTYTLAGVEDKLELGSGIALSDLMGTINASGDYVLTIGAGTDTLTFKNWKGGNKLASLKLADNTLISTAQLEELAGIVNGTAGNDVIAAAQAIDYVINGGGGVDTITGNSGNDSITGGTGNDIIAGGIGADTYQFGLGDGQDTYTLAGVEDKLELGTGIALSDLTGIINASGDYVLTIGAGTDTLTFKNWRVGNKLASLKLADNTLLSTAQLEELAGIVNGTAGDDTIKATKAMDYTINGGAGADTITGNSGKDNITGGTGNDTIEGGTGIDTYQFGRGDGQDTYTLSGLEDKLELGSGIALSDLKGTINGSGDYVLTIGAGTDTLTFKNWNGGNKLASMKLADNTLLSTAQLNELTGIMNGTAGNDTITATLAIDHVMSGSGGVDTITGNAGNDTITGGTGNDIITGGAGVDTYIFNVGDGKDTYKPAGIEDRLKLGAGITLADLNGSVNASGHYVLTVRDTTNTLTFNNWSTGNKLAAIELANGTVLSTAQIEALKHTDVVGTSSANTLKGNSTTAIREHLQGLAGNDTLYGYGGADFLDGGAGNDTLYGGAGNDQYIFTGTFGQDSIINNTSAAADVDAAYFAYDSSKLVLSMSGSDLKMKIAGQTDNVLVKSWSSGGLNVIDDIQTQNGKHLVGTQVAQLIQAMATFTTQTGLTWEQAAQQNNQQYVELLATYYQQ